MWLFTVATLTPVVLIVAAALLGRPWSLAALAYMSLLAFALDEVIRLVTPPEDADREFPAADTLSVALALSHFGLIVVSVWALSGTWLDAGEKLALFVAAGWFFGQVSNSNAHELIHRTSRPLHTLGKWVYITMLFGHHTSAHPLVHHVHVATDKDPNSAKLGETYYGFLPRAWIGSFRAGMRSESARLARVNAPGWRHPYVIYVGGALACLALALSLGGLPALLWMIALCGFATSQLMLSDYVQHYGLRRATRDNGKPEPVSDRHSWNAPHWFTSSLMLNAPRHSDHHAHPARPYPALRLNDNTPTLPRSLPVMGALAMIPPVWRRVMDPRVRAVQGQ